MLRRRRGGSVAVKTVKRSTHFCQSEAILAKKCSILKLLGIQRARVRFFLKFFLYFVIFGVKHWVLLQFLQPRGLRLKR